MLMAASLAELGHVSLCSQLPRKPAATAILLAFLALLQLSSVPVALAQMPPLTPSPPPPATTKAEDPTSFQANTGPIGWLLSITDIPSTVLQVFFTLYTLLVFAFGIYKWISSTIREARAPKDAKHPRSWIVCLLLRHLLQQELGVADALLELPQHEARSPAALELYKIMRGRPEQLPDALKYYDALTIIQGLRLYLRGMLAGARGSFLAALRHVGRPNSPPLLALLAAVMLSLDRWRATTVAASCLWLAHLMELQMSTPRSLALLFGPVFFSDEEVTDPNAGPAYREPELSTDQIVRLTEHLLLNARALFLTPYFELPAEITNLLRREMVTALPPQAGPLGENDPMQQWRPSGPRFLRMEHGSPKTLYPDNIASRGRVHFFRTCYNESEEEIAEARACDGRLGLQVYGELYLIVDYAGPNAFRDDMPLWPQLRKEVQFWVRAYGLEEVSKTKAPEQFTWFGAALHTHLGFMAVHIVLKDTCAKVRQGKRWSHVLGISILLERNPAAAASDLLMLLDADTTFDAESIFRLRDVMQQPGTEALGGVAGRIMPHGETDGIVGDLVVYEQQFSYMIAHFLMKAAEQYAGSTLCLPGCFSMIRLAAFLGPPATPFRFGANTSVPPPGILYRLYAKYMETASDVFLLAQAEDRTLCTWLTQTGWRLTYCPTATAQTFCPTSFADYYVQQRRWNTGTIENLVLLLNHRNLPWLLHFITWLQLISVFLAPILILLLMMEGARFMGWFGYAISLGIPIIYHIVCALTYLDADLPAQVQGRLRSLQLRFAEGLALLYTFHWIIVLCVLVTQMFRAGLERVSATAVYFAMMVLVYPIVALLHWKDDKWLVLKAFTLLLFTPSHRVLLSIYTLANFHSFSWGTREAAGASHGPKAPEASPAVAAAAAALAQASNAAVLAGPAGKAKLGQAAKPGAAEEANEEGEGAAAAKAERPPKEDENAGPHQKALKDLEALAGLKDQLPLLQTLDSFHATGQLPGLQKRVADLEERVRGMQPRGSIGAASAGGKTAAELREQIAAVQAILFNPESNERDVVAANVELEKLFAQYEATADARQEAANVLKARQKKHRKANLQALATQRRKFSLDNLSTQPQLAEYLNARPELKLILYSPAHLMKLHGNDYRNFVLSRLTLEELRAVRAAMPEFREDQVLQHRFLQSLDDKIEQLCEAMQPVQIRSSPPNPAAASAAAAPTAPRKPRAATAGAALQSAQAKKPAAAALPSLEDRPAFLDELAQKVAAKQAAAAARGPSAAGGDSPRTRRRKQLAAAEQKAAPVLAPAGKGKEHAP